MCKKEISLFISILTCFQGQKLFDVRPDSFNPPPKVVSSVIEILPLEQNIMANIEIDNFIEFLTFGFKSPRKTNS